MALKDFAFKVLKKDKFARCGLIETHRGNINTPAFMPVGTQATVKACTIDDIKKITFSQAFARHQAAGDEVFTWRNNQYTTKLKGEADG